MPLVDSAIAIAFVAPSVFVFPAMGDECESLLVSSLGSAISAIGLDDELSVLLSSEAVVNF